MLSTLNRWPSIWDEELDLLPANFGNNLEVYETEDEIVVRANVAGVSKDDLDVTFEKGILWIRAETNKEEDDQKRKYHAKSSWNYSYKVGVPGEIDYTKDPVVELKRGLLEITISKAERSKPKKLSVTSQEE